MDEITELCVASMVFYGAAAVWMVKGHFSAGNWITKVCRRPRLVSLYRAGVELVSLVFMAILFRYSLKLTLRSEEVTAVFQIPKAVQDSCMPVASAVMCLYLPGRAQRGAHGGVPAERGGMTASIPSLAAWSLPFLGLLLCVALLPVIPACAGWWRRNPSKLALSLAFAALVSGYYLMRGQGAQPGLASAGAMLRASVVDDYLPFIVLLFSLFTISGGIRLTGDVSARPGTNTLILFLGSVLASLIGTTGASMLLIRPLLQINSERRRTRHTVVFFIFLVSNIGGSLLPVGDPPLFLGFLKGVPFFWNLRLWPTWLFSVGVLLALYRALDAWHYAREDPEALRLDQTTVQPFRLQGKANLLLLAGVVLAVAVLVPGQPIPGTALRAPAHLREAVELALCGLSLACTSGAVRRANQFSFAAILEVACLFIGIFVTMQVPIELLRAAGPGLGSPSRPGSSGPRADCPASWTAPRPTPCSSRAPRPCRRRRERPCCTCWGRGAASRCASWRPWPWGPWSWAPTPTWATGPTSW